jgi:flagellar biosynthesis GTPase FlhF
MTQTWKVRATSLRILTAFALIAGTALVTARADDDPDKEAKKAAEKAEKEKEKAAKEKEKEKEKAAKEEKKREEKLAKEAKERNEKGEKGDKEDKGEKTAKDGKAPLSPPTPAVAEKTGEPIRDFVVDFEKAYAAGLPHFEVDEFTKHDYDACQKDAQGIVDAAKCISRMHEDRIRQYGNDYHHQLEGLAKSANRLLAAVKQHNRTDIFTYWAELKLERDTLALTPPWRP